MKKTVVLAILMAMAIIISGCDDTTGGTASPSASATPSQYTENTIAPDELTSEEQSLLNIIGSNSTFFDFTATSEVTSIQVWTELYKDGELTGSSLGHTQYITTGDGKIAVTWTGVQSSRALLSISSGGGVSRTSFEVGNLLEQGYGMGSVKLTEKITVQADTEIVIMAYAYSSGSNGVTSYDSIDLSDIPGSIGQYDMVYVIKCSFSTSQTTTQST